jgi:hypothetical protein
VIVNRIQINNKTSLFKKINKEEINKEEINKEEI